MKIHSTNYYNTLIEIAEDCAAQSGQQPVIKENVAKSIAAIQFDLLQNHPYQFTSDDVIFETFSIKNNIPEEERETARTTFFSKGQPCLRCSQLSKKLGWGIHYNAEGKIALVSAGSALYSTLQQDESLKKVKAFRSKRG